jgi:putative endonuclease
VVCRLSNCEIASPSARNDRTGRAFATLSLFVITRLFLFVITRSSFSCHCEERQRRSNLIWYGMEKQYFVYIMTNKANSVLYTGVTSDLKKRAYEHRNKMMEGFTKKYKIAKLVYYELFTAPLQAIAREKQIKGGSRQKKDDLINQKNPDWNDLYDEL